MKFTRASTAAALALVGADVVAAANVVKAGISRSTSFQQTAAQRLKPRAEVTSTIANNLTAGSYLIDVEIGTPGQPISLVVDTGSSDVFALSTNADLCNSLRLQVEYGVDCSGGQFDGNKSSTFKVVNNDFLIQYADSSAAAGYYFTDTITIGKSSIKQQQMGLAIETSVGSGIMGLGYATNEAAQQEYASIIDQMVSQGVINTKAYSLYLDDLQASSGSIIFGGIDTAKFSGELISLPIEKDANDEYSSFTVALSGVSITDEDGKTNSLTNSTFAEPVVLDSGTTLTYIPDALCNSIYTALGVTLQTVEQQSVPLIDCNVVNTKPKITVDYSFGGSGGPTIKVPIDELVIQSGGIDISGLGLSYTEACIFGIMSGGSSDAGNLLGDTFLRSAYVVYDIKNNEVGLAQTSFNQTSSSIVEFQASATGIPNASGVASAVTVAASNTAKPAVGGVGAVGATVSSSNTAAATSTSKAAGVSTVPEFDASRLAVLAASGLFALAGGSWFLSW